MSTTVAKLVSWVDYYIRLVKVLVFCEIKSNNELILTICHTMLVNRPVRKVISISYFATVCKLFECSFRNCWSKVFVCGGHLQKQRLF